MDHNLVRLRQDDGSWGNFEADWRAQCEGFGEDYDQFALGSLPVLRELAGETRDDAGVFGLSGEDGTFAAVAQANSTLLPGYTGKVLRVRHMLMSPTLDFGELSVQEYAVIMSRLFTRAVGLAFKSMPSAHVKFHLRSPTDRHIFSSAIETMREFEIFASVAMRGAWLYLTLKPIESIAVGEVG